MYNKLKNHNSFSPFQLGGVSWKIFVLVFNFKPMNIFYLSFMIIDDSSRHVCQGGGGDWEGE